MTWAEATYKIVTEVGAGLFFLGLFLALFTGFWEVLGVALAAKYLDKHVARSKGVK